MLQSSVHVSNCVSGSSEVTQRRVRRLGFDQIVREISTTTEDVEEIERRGPSRADIFANDEDVGSLGGFPGIRELQIRAH